MTAALEVAVERRFERGPAITARFEVPAGTAVTVLFGPSGAGKSTVLQAVAGLDPAVTGIVRAGGATWLDSEAGVRVPARRRGVGMVFQDGALFPHLDVAGNLAFGLRGVERGRRADRLAEVARLLGLGGLMARRPAQLSGGERQRVALARALAPWPRLVLLDEPLSALDAPAREALRGELRASLLASGTPAILVTHDRLEALALGDRMVVLASGQVRQEGPVADVISRPADLEVARVVGTENVVRARVVDRDPHGLTRLAVGEVSLMSASDARPGDEGWACFRAEDVILEAVQENLTSASNALVGTVERLAEEGPLVRVLLGCGFPLVALITRQSAQRLELAVGARAMALIKAPGVRLVR